MTTGPETIAAAIRDGFRELAEAIASRETPRMGPRSDEQAAGVHNCLTCGRDRAREINDLRARAAVALGISQKDLQRIYGVSRSVLQRILAEAP